MDCSKAIALVLCPHIFTKLNPNTKYIVVLYLGVLSIIWQKMQSCLSVKFQWFLDLLHKRISRPGNYLKYVL